MIALSRTERVSGPKVPSECQRCGYGAVETLPRDGLSPYRPQQEDGIRIDPPPSPAIPAATMPEATAAAVPPLEPPVERSVSQGLRVMPVVSDSVNGHWPNSGMQVLPT